MSMHFPKWDPDLATEELDRAGDVRGGLLNALHVVQRVFGHVPEAARDLLAERFNLSRAEVLGVTHFYDDFRDKPPSKLIARVCRGEACQAVGGQRLFDAARKRDDIETEQVFCLGNCACGPTAEIGGIVHGRLSEVRLLQVIEGVKEGGENV